MEGQQLPKATMSSFLKKQTTSPFSADYLAKVLYIAKEFIARLADKSNITCQSFQKKTISAEHLEAALTQFGLTDHLADLKSLEETIKEQNQLKREASQRLEEMLAKDLQQQRERRKLQQQTSRKQITLRQRLVFDSLMLVQQKKGQDFDYQNMDENDCEIANKES